MTSHKKYSLPQRIHLDKPSITKELSREMINQQIKKQDNHSKINNKKQLTAIRLSLDLKRLKQNLPQAKSEHSIGRKTSYKQRIVHEKKSYNLLSKKKPRSYSIDQSFHSLKKQDKQGQESESKTNRPRLINLQDINATFLSQCYRRQVEYNNYCMKGKYSFAFENLAMLLNYSVDISSQAWFFKILYGMCQFYQILQVYKLALKLYNEMKEAALLKKNYQYLTISLIGISKCASHAKLENESISILKKALEYAWFIESTELQLNIYDQLGEQYYKMGEIDRASVYHKKYSSSITQQKNSPLRTLSKQQLQIQEQKNLSHNYQNLSPLLLAHLNLPITSIEQLPALIPGLFTSRSKLSLKTLKTQMESYQIDYQIKKILKTWLFEVESSQPNIENTKNELTQSFQNSRKFLYLDFKLNYHLKMKGINYSNPRSYMRNSNIKQEVRKKENLQQQIKRFVQDPGLQKQWYQNIVKRVQVDQKRKMSHINDPVRLNKSILSMKNKNQNLKSLFKQIVELSKILRIETSFKNKS